MTTILKAILICLLPLHVWAENPEDIIQKSLQSVIGIYSESQDASPSSSGRIGAGVIISKEGHAITNAHVITQSRQIVVQLNDGQKLYADVIGADEQSDLALLKINTNQVLTPMPIGKSDSIHIGSQVIAIGNPFGLSQSVTQGIVSSLHRSDTSSRIQDFIQIDAPINPGNSGGALLNSNGQLVGINTSIISVPKSDDKSVAHNIGIGFAIPMDIAIPIVKQLQKNGRLQPAMLGIVSQNVDHNLAQALNFDQDYGVLVTDTVPQSPAAKADIKPLDIIMSINGVKIFDYEHLRSIIAAHGPDFNITLKLMRNKKIHTLSLKTTAPISNKKNEHTNAFKGIHVVNHEALELGQSKVTGLRVVFIEDQTKAALSGLLPNDIITHINNQPLTSIDSFSQMFTKLPKNNILTCLRGNRLMYFALNN